MGETVPFTDPQELRNRILAFEDTLLEYDQVDIPVVQRFSHGIYMREIIIPAGVLAVGKIHKHPCLSVVLTGKMEVVTDQGPKIVEAGQVFESPAGVKRAGRAIKDCRWITVHPWDGPELDEDLMAAELTVDTYAQLELYERKQLEDQA